MSREHVRIAWAINGWGPQAWLEALAKADPAMEIVTDAEPGDTSIRYAIAWKQTPGYLAGFPSLKAIFSAGACAWSIPISPIA
jgi:glyoxylate/hydroxypyruvate reductase A